jgi:3-deoxy-D-manno-octulosonic acid hydroxylase-like protein
MFKMLPTPMNPLVRINITSWTGPFGDDTRAEALRALEHGKVLVFEQLPFFLEERERVFLSPSVSDGKSKNVSLKPSGEMGGTSLAGEEADTLRKMIERYAQTATNFLTSLVPKYAGRVERTQTSYRPVKIEGRQQSAIHDDTRLHVDAFPSRPMRGRRIMRLFTNVNPEGNPRVWHVGEPFEDMARRMLPRAKGASPMHSWFLAAAGITKGRRSAYDDLMLGLHDNAKLDERYQKECPQIEAAFMPGATWLCYTDQVMHAALSGQYVLEQTFHLDIEAMAQPELSPLRALERMKGRALV